MSVGRMAFADLVNEAEFGRNPEGCVNRRGRRS